MAIQLGDKNMYSTFFGKLMYYVTCAKLCHLTVKGVGSYASHSALGSFYDDLSDKADNLIESIYGKMGIIPFNVPACSCNNDPVDLLTSFVNDCEMFITKVKESWIKNEIDTLTQLGYHTLYKLKNLK